MQIIIRNLNHWSLFHKAIIVLSEVHFKVHELGLGSQHYICFVTWGPSLKPESSNISLVWLTPKAESCKGKRTKSSYLCNAYIVCMYTQLYTAQSAYFIWIPVSCLYARNKNIHTRLCMMLNLNKFLQPLCDTLYMITPCLFTYINALHSVRHTVHISYLLQCTHVQSTFNFPCYIRIRSKHSPDVLLHTFCHQLRFSLDFHQQFVFQNTWPHFNKGVYILKCETVSSSSFRF